MILEKTIELIYQIYKSYRIIKPLINQIVFGLRYTAIELHAYMYSPFIGLSYVPYHNILKSKEYNDIEFQEKLKEKRLSEILKWSYGPTSIKKTVGIATLNAMSQHLLEIKNPFKIRKNLISYLKIKPDTNILFIGTIIPLIYCINKITENIIFVSDQIVSKSLFNKISIKKSINDLRNEEKAADILFFTEEVLINDKLEEFLIKFKKKARTIVLIGPSASMIPDILFDYGIDIVVGTKIINHELALKIIKEGRGLKSLEHFSKNYCLINE